MTQKLEAIEAPAIRLYNTGLHLLDTNASHDLIIAPGSDLTADRTLSIVTGDADRTLTLANSGTAVVGTGTATRLAEWSDANTIAASTLIKTGAGVLTLDAGGAYTLTVPATGTAALLATANVFTAAQTIPAGAVNNPSLRFAGDLTTGIYDSYPTGGRIAFVSNNRLMVEIAYDGYFSFYPSSGMWINYVLTGNGGILYKRSEAATAGTTVIQSPSHFQRGSYWDGAASVEVTLIQETVPNTTPDNSRASWNFDGGFSILSLLKGGDVLIGTYTDSGQLAVDQSSATGAQPVLFLDQGDDDETMIEFAGAIGTGYVIEAVGAKTLTTTHFLKVEITGVGIRYIPMGTIA